MAIRKKFPKVTSRAESSYQGRVRTPWIPAKAGEAQNHGTPINSVSAGHVVVGTIRKKSD